MERKFSSVCELAMALQLRRWSCVSLQSLIAFELDSLPLFLLPFSKDTLFALACVGIHMNVLKSVHFWFMHVYVKT